MPTHTPRHRRNLGLAGAQPSAMQPGFAAPPMAMPQQAPQQGGGFMQGLQDNSGLLMALGSQLLQHRQNAAEPMVNAQALMLGQRVDEKRRDKRKETEKDRKMRFNTAALAVKHGVASNLDEAMQMVDASPELVLKGLEQKIAPTQQKLPTSFQEFLLGQQHPEFAQHLQESDGGGVFGTPIHGTKDGKPVLGAIRKDGGGLQWFDDQGVDITPGVTYQDLGDRLLPVWRQSGQPIGPEIQKGGSPSGDQRPAAEGGVEPIPGSKLDVERQGAEAAQAEAQRMKEIQTDFVTEKIDEAIGQIEGAEWPVTGFFGSVLENVPGTPAHDIQRNLTTVKANLGFDKLQSMRDASPTGGALGQVSERENELLQAVWGDVQQSQSKDQLLRNLRRLKALQRDIIHGGPVSKGLRESGVITGDGATGSRQGGQTSTGTRWRIAE